MINSHNTLLRKAHLIKLNAYTFYAIGTYNRLWGNSLRIRRNGAITQCKYYKKIFIMLSDALNQQPRNIIDVIYSWSISWNAAVCDYGFDKALRWSLNLLKSICTTEGGFFFSTTPSTDRMQFYYWNCLLMIPNYPVEHSGEGQFQASNLCCNHRENHTCNTAVAFTSQQHKQKDRESESRVGVKKKKVKSVWEFSRNMEGWVRCQVEKRETLVEKLRLIFKISIS